MEERSMSDGLLLKIRVMLKGRPVRTKTFTKSLVTIGRNPEADIFLDNPGISREHLKLEATGTGDWFVQDLGSANGTLLNDAPVQRRVVADNDVIRIGKYSLWVNFENERRGSASGTAHPSPDVEDGTVVLTSSELQGMITRARKIEGDGPPPSEDAPAPFQPAVEKPAPKSRWSGAFVVGALFGALAAWLASRFLFH
jgi:predicted component of type VI protein secretion system